MTTRHAKEKKKSPLAVQQFLCRIQAKTRDNSSLICLTITVFYSTKIALCRIKKLQIMVLLIFSFDEVIQINFSLTSKHDEMNITNRPISIF